MNGGFVKRIALIVFAFALLAGNIVADEKQRVKRVDSPLVVEIPVSPVVKTIMEGAWWFDRSMAHYSVEGVRLLSVGVTKKRKKKDIVLMIRAEVASDQYAVRVDEVLIELLVAGEVVGDFVWDGLVGKEMKGMGVGTTQRPTLEYRMKAQDFEALFADSAQPVARVTITEED